MSALALDKKQVVPQLERLVEDYLKSENYAYNYVNDKKRFDLQFNMDSLLKKVAVSVYLYHDMVSVSVYTLQDVPEEYRDNMAKLLTLINNNIFYAQFRMNYEDGALISRSYILIESVLPGAPEMNVLLHEPLNAMDDYGDAIMKVMKGGDPAEAYQKAEDKQK